MNVQCPVCGRREVVPGAVAPVDLADIAIFVCDRCGVRVAHGKVMPKVVVEPHTDERGFTWARHRIQDPKTKQDLFVYDLDPKFAAAVATNTLSLIIVE